MKRYVKITLVLMALMLVCALVVGCGGEVAETEGAPEQTESAAGETKHVHATTGGPVETKASTCCEQGYIQYRCDECHARYVEELPLGKHDYKTRFDATLGYEVVKCDGCGDWRMEVDGKQTISLAAACSGSASITFTVMGGDAQIDFFVDGTLSVSDSYAAGEHTVSFAEGMGVGGHTFDIVLKNNGTGLDITDLSTNGTMHRRDGVILEMTKTTAAHGGTYNDFFVYTRTSDPSGEYYIRYRFFHSYNTDLEGKTDSSNNNNMFRIIGAELVRVESVSETAVKYKSLHNLLTAGEIAVAIKEPDSVDFIGGYHGEEHILELWMYADNEEYTPGDEAKVVVCSYLEFYQLTDIGRCNTPDEKIVNHEQTYRITADGIRCARNIEWLVDNFEYTTAYIQMFTMLRKDGTNTICETVETFDADGNSFGVETVDYEIEKDKWVLKSPQNRTVKYSSATSGISAEVGFVILENSVQTDSVHVSLRRDGIGDNKWYASFKSAKGSKFSTKGDVWKLDMLYSIDYVNPENE